MEALFAGADGGAAGVDAAGKRLESALNEEVGKKTSESTKKKKPRLEELGEIQPGAYGGAAGEAKPSRSEEETVEPRGGFM